MPSARPCRRDRHRAAALPAALAGALAVTVLATAAPVAAQAPTPPPTGTSTSSPAPSPVPEPSADPLEACESASEESPVVVQVTRLLPRAPSRADEPFQVAGRLVNCGDEQLRDVQVRLAVGPQIRSRSELALAAEEPVVGRRRLAPQDAQGEQLTAGGSTAFDVRVLVGDLQLGSRNGVFPLAVQVRARTAEGSVRRPVGLASTFVPWFPDGPIAPTRLAWVTPLVDEPRRGPGEVMLDDELDDLLEDDSARPGRLHRALSAARQGAQGGCDDRAAAAVPVVPTPPAATPAPPGATPPAPACRGDAVPMTYAVDPDLLYTVEAMTRPYTVRVGDRAVDRPASDNAEQWLVAVRAAAREGDVLALPYGDPDVVALSRTDSPVKDDVVQLSRLGQAEARRLLGAAPQTDVAWPPPGPVDPVVDPLAAGDDTALLVDASALPPPDSLQDRTPSARTTLPSTTGPVTALVADEALSALVEPDRDSDDWQGPRLAEQRWLAEAAVLTAERPSTSRTIVVAPRRRADLDPGVLAAAIADTGRVPWLCPVSLRAAAAGTEQCAGPIDVQPPAELEDRGAPRRKQDGDVELSQEFVRELAEVRRASDQFTEQVLIGGSDSAKETKARLLRARGRTASSAWRERPSGGRRMLSLLQGDVTDLRSRVSLIGGPALLTGRSGTIQLVVQNGHDQPVNVGVRLDPTSAARLSSQDAELQVVPGRSSRQVSVRVEARTSGRFTARAQLVDAGGRPFGTDVELAVRSSEYGRVALAVTGIAAAVLLVAAGARITRRAMRRPEEDPA